MQAADYVFARLGLDDLEALVALERVCFSAPWGEKEFRLGLENQVFKVFGLRAPDGLAAYCSFYHVADEMEVLNIAVRPDLRRRGLGARLLGLVLQICENMGITSAHLEVRVGNDAARALYARYGFAPVGLRKGYYPDNGEDALCMALEMGREMGRKPGQAGAAKTPADLDNSHEVE